MIPVWTSPSQDNKQAKKEPWTTQSKEFANLVLFSSVVVLSFMIIDAFLFARSFLQFCSQNITSNICKEIRVSETTIPLADSTLPTGIAATVTQRTPISTAEETVRIVASVQLNVRSQPGIEHPVVLVLNRGDQVSLLGKSVQVDGSTWVQIRVAGVTGWVNSKFLTEASTAVTTAVTTNTSTRIVASVQLNVRSQPGIEHPVILVLNRGEQVYLLGNSVQIDGSTWVEIRVKGVRGWVNARFLR